jgi:hypothetical protein
LFQIKLNSSSVHALHRFHEKSEFFSACGVGTFRNFIAAAKTHEFPCFLQFLEKSQVSAEAAWPQALRVSVCVLRHCASICVPSISAAF